MAESPRLSENPYAPPAGGEAEWQPSELPPGAEPPHTAVPRVFGILSIIFGSMVLLFGLLGSCTGFAAQGLLGFGERFGGAEPAGNEMREAMSYMKSIYFAMGLQSLFFVALSAMLLAVGIGQVRYRRWAARWSVYWGALALVAVVGLVIISVAIMGPAYQKFFDALSRSGPSGVLPTSFTSSLSGLFGGTSGLMVVVFYAPYPILLLIYFTRDMVRAAMNR